MSMVNVKFVVKMMESERGWGQDYWDEEFNTREEAEAHMKQTNARNTSIFAPDYYVQALRIEIVEVHDD